jgi:Flp pilus assembly protein TadG
MVFLQITMFVVVSMFIAMAVDLGRVQSVKNDLETAADAAARAGAGALAQGTTAAQNAAVQIAGYNTADGQPVTLNASTDIVFGRWDPTATPKFKVLSGAQQANANAIQVTAARLGASGVQLTWGRLMGMNTCNARATAIACSTGSSGQASLIGLNSITVSGTAYTDSYDATKGAYNAATAKKNGSIASNGDIALQNTAKVNGDVRCGIGKKTTIAGTATVTGLNAPMASQATYPSVTMPSSYTDLGDVNMSSGTVYLSGGTYLIHNLTLSGTSHIIYTGPATLYIQNSYNISQSATIDTYQNLPINRKLNFLPTCTTATWTGTNDCVGELYAPDTDFSISGSVDLYGRVTAKSITLSGGGGMHYDESLTPPGGTTVRESVTLVQ